MTFVPSHPHLRLGRKPKTFKPMLGFGQVKTLLKGTGALTAPVTFDYSLGLPSDLNVMFNDSLGLCADAAKYHRWQGVQWLMNKRFWDGSVLADLALRLYELEGKYNPQDPSTDQGTNMQDMARYLVETGMLQPDLTLLKFYAAFNVDPSNVIDLSYCGSECVGIDFGIRITTKVMPEDGSPPPLLWDAGGKYLNEGHDIYAFARAENGQWKINSWGKWYYLTQAFVEESLDEAVAYVAPDIFTGGKTVLGLDESTVENLATGYAHKVV